MPGQAERPPLADVRVIAVEQYGAGPWGTLQLSDLGAEVIKIEDPSSGGDVGRYVPPFQEDEDSLFFETFNHNKRSLSLDLRHPDGRAVLEDLVRHADAVYSNLRGDQPAKLRLTYDDLRQLDPRIVCVSLSGFGMTGPRAAEAGYDYIMQAMAGWMSLTGEPDGPPTKSGLSLVDLSGGYVSALALLAGLHRARRDGVGCDADISLFETALHQLMYVGTWTATGGYKPRRLPDSAHPSIVPFQAFATADGWITIACAKQKFWERLCEVLDRRDLLADPRFADFAGREHHRDELVPEIAAILRRSTTQEWTHTLTAAGVPNGPVYEVAGALEDAQTAARGDVIAINHPRFGEVRQVASLLRLSGASTPPARAPFRGEDTDRILREVCGYGTERVAALRAAGVLAVDPFPNQGKGGFQMADTVQAGEMIEVRGANLWHQISGDGEPVLQIHGSGFGHFNFGPATPLLSDQFRCIDYDQRGYGQSEKPQQDYDIEVWADDDAGMLDSLGIERAHVHGTSMGGMVAILMAGKYPERVQAVVINCAAAKLGFSGQLVFRNWIDLIRLEGCGSRTLAELISWQCLSRAYMETPEGQAGVDTIQQILRDANEDRVMIQACQAMIDMDLRDSVGKISSPALVLGGDEDVMTPWDQGPVGAGQQWIADHLPNGEVYVVKGSNHSTIFDGTEEHCRAVADFFKRHPGAA